ncbi:MAG: copper transporter [Corynebacterium sp.]|nr:copper transporter [Corynebacterium sp.]
MAHISRTIAGLGFGIALGVAVGSYALAPNLPSEDSSSNGAASNSSSESNSIDEVAAAQLAAGDDFDLAFASSLVADDLAGRPVLVMATADAEDSDIADVNTILRAAGATDAGTVNLGEEFFTQDGADQLKNIIATTLAAGAQLSEDRLDSGTHAGESLGSVLLLDPETGAQQSSVEDRALVLQSLREAGFIDYTDGTILPAQAILLVTGDDDGAEDSFAAKNQASFATALEARGSGVVVAGRVHAASETGVLGVLRNGENPTEVSTVDSLERGWAKVAVVQAIAEQLAGSNGDYGIAEGSSGPAPGIRRSNGSDDAAGNESTAAESEDATESSAASETETAENSDAQTTDDDAANTSESAAVTAESATSEASE